MIKAGIVGATGYVGAELVRLIALHPQAELSAVSSVSFEGKPLSEVYPMIPKMDCCVDAVQRGVNRAHIIDGRIPHSILIEAFTDEGIGTMIY